LKDNLCPECKSCACNQGISSCCKQSNNDLETKSEYTNHCSNWAPEEEISEKLAFVRFNMECEDFTLTDENTRTGREILLGNITGNDAVKQTLHQYNLTKPE
jgi:hypothetical protein